MRFYVLVVILFLSVLSINGQENSKKDAKFTESMTRGAIIYEDFCVTCHLPDGEGVAKTFPPLAKSDYLMNKREGSIKAIKFGQQGEIIVNGITFNNTMAPLGLTDEEIADVMNYITNNWGNKNGKMITISEVSKIEQ